MCILGGKAGRQAGSQGILRLGKVIGWTLRMIHLFRSRRSGPVRFGCLG